MKWQRINAAVYQTKEDIVWVSKQEIDWLKKAIVATPDKRIRLCAHTNVQDSIHEMLIAVQNNSYIRPHKHPGKSESFHMIEGAIDVIIFDEMGEIRDIIALGDILSDQSFYYRLSQPYFHTIHVKTEIAIFHETTTGPFTADQTVYPEWSPHPQAQTEVIKYQQQLLMKIHQHQNKKDSLCQ